MGAQSEYFVGAISSSFGRWRKVRRSWRRCCTRRSRSGRRSSGELPARNRDVSLQVVIREWGHAPAIDDAANQIERTAGAGAHRAPAFMTLVNDYAVALDDYLKEAEALDRHVQQLLVVAAEHQKVAAEAASASIPSTSAGRRFQRRIRPTPSPELARIPP